MQLGSILDIWDHKSHQSSSAITDFMEMVLLSSEMHHLRVCSSEPYLKILLKLLTLRPQELVILGANDSF